MKNLYKKLFDIQGLAVKKDGINTYHKNHKYQTLDKILETLLPILKENNLLLTHRTENQKVITTLIDLESDDTLESSIDLIGDNPQKYGSCITYYKRYNIGQLFNIVTDEDDDGNKASAKPKPAATTPTPKPQATPVSSNTAPTSTKICPNCGKPMAKRKGSLGEFWGCTGYKPDKSGCSNTEPIEDVKEEEIRIEDINF